MLFGNEEEHFKRFDVECEAPWTLSAEDLNAIEKRRLHVAFCDPFSFVHVITIDGRKLNEPRCYGLLNANEGNLGRVPVLNPGVIVRFFLAVRSEHDPCR